MARIRTIKPEFFTSEDIVSLSPLARLLYVALWCEADKEGRMVWKPKTFKMRYMPGDDCDIVALCDEILGAGLVVLYGDGYAFIPAFGAHQHINPRETPSQLPDPDASRTRAPRVGTRHSRDSDAQGGREGKGKEGDNDASPSEPEGFVAFWGLWPSGGRKGARVKCLDAWRGKRLESQSAAILAHVAALKASEDWRKDGGRFIPAPLAYLNGAKWDGADIGARESAFAGGI
jgi:hypothetical protein